MKAKALWAAITLLSTPVYALEGRIVGTDGQGISGALVEVVGKRLSVTTDEQGNFKLDTDEVDELHVSAPGFSHKVIHIHQNSGSAQNIILSRSALEQVDVVGIPMHASNIESTIPVTVLTGDELRNKQAATLGDTLADEVGIHTSFHGNVASTPIIRGLSGPRVLITQNSLDTSDVSRVGPDHSVATETSTAEQVEVLRGPATLFYGSGAIGGVVNVVDKRVPTDTNTTGEWIVSHDSVNDQKLGSFNLNSGVGNIGLHLDGFWRESNDYDVPESPEIDEDHGEDSVANTAEESNGFTFGSSYILDNGYIGFSYGKLEREYGVPGHSHGEEEHEEEEEEHEEHEEEEVLLDLDQDRFQLISEFTLDHALISAINARVGYTDYTHTEFENGESGTEFTNETTELRLEVMHQAMSDWRGGLVFDYKNSEFEASGDEAFAPPSETETFAIALIEEKHFGDVLVQMGARIEHVNINSNDVEIPEVEFHHHDEEGEEEEEEHEEHEHETFTFDEDYMPFSVSVGAVWEFAPGYNIGVSLSHAERAPSAAELLSFGPHIATGTFEIGALFEPHEEDDEIHFERRSGTPDMEKSNNIDITFRKFEGDIGIIINAFYNQVENYYTEFDTELFAEAGHAHDEEEGEEEEGHEHAGELPVFLFQSADATLWGFEAQGVWQVNQNFKTTLFADYVRGRLDDFDDGDDLPRIPPLRFGASVDYTINNMSANLSWTRFDDQHRSAQLETETDGYDWVNASINYRIPFNNQELTVFLKGENLTDDEARVHSSFIKDVAPRPGRNFRIGIRGTF